MLTLGEKPRILITRADRLGDLVISTAVFPEIRKKYPKAYLAALTFLENREVLEGNPFLDEIFLYDKQGSEKNFFGNWKFAQRLRSKKFDMVIHLHATNRMHQLAWLAGIPVRIGWDRRSPWALTQVYPDIKKQGKKHEAEYNFDLLESLRIRVPEKMKIYFPVSPRSEASLEMLLKQRNVPKDLDWIVLGPGASCPSKRWPAHCFKEAAQQIHRQKPHLFFGIGTSQDRYLLEQIQQDFQAPFFDLSGRLSLGMLGVLLKRSSLLITNDSGPAHIAAALGTPVVSIFGRNQPGLSPVRWRPLGEKSSFIWKNVGCDPCLAHACQIHFLCLDVIPSEEVAKESLQWL